MSAAMLPFPSQDEQCRLSPPLALLSDPRFDLDCDERDNPGMLEMQDGLDALSIETTPTQRGDRRQSRILSPSHPPRPPLLQSSTDSSLRRLLVALHPDRYEADPVTQEPVPRHSRTPRQVNSELVRPAAARSLSDTQQASAMPRLFGSKAAPVPSPSTQSEPAHSYIDNLDRCFCGLLAEEDSIYCSRVCARQDALGALCAASPSDEAPDGRSPFAPSRLMERVSSTTSSTSSSRSNSEYGSHYRQIAKAVEAKREESQRAERERKASSRQRPALSPPLTRSSRLNSLDHAQPPSNLNMVVGLPRSDSKQATSKWVEAVAHQPDLAHRRPSQGHAANSSTSSIPSLTMSHSTSNSVSSTRSFHSADSGDVEIASPTEDQRKAAYLPAFVHSPTAPLFSPKSAVFSPAGSNPDYFSSIYQNYLPTPTIPSGGFEQRTPKLGGQSDRFTYRSSSGFGGLSASESLGSLMLAPSEAEDEEEVRDRVASAGFYVTDEGEQRWESLKERVTEHGAGQHKRGKLSFDDMLNVMGSGAR